MRTIDSCETKMGRAALCTLSRKSVRGVICALSSFNKHNMASRKFRHQNESMRKTYIIMTRLPARFAFARQQKKKKGKQIFVEQNSLRKRFSAFSSGIEICQWQFSSRKMSSATYINKTDGDGVSEYYMASMADGVYM